jgi:hypothetical protein
MANSLVAVGTGYPQSKAAFDLEGKLTTFQTDGLDRFLVQPSGGQPERGNLISLMLNSVCAHICSIQICTQIGSIKASAIDSNSVHIQSVSVQVCLSRLGKLAGKNRCQAETSGQHESRQIVEYKLMQHGEVSDV